MATRHVKYVGPFDAVDVPDANVTVKRGETVEVDADIAKALARQPTWEAVGEKPADEPQDTTPPKGGTRAGDGATKDGA